MYPSRGIIYQNLLYCTLIIAIVKSMAKQEPERSYLQRLMMQRVRCLRDRAVVLIVKCRLEEAINVIKHGKGRCSRDYRTHVERGMRASVQVA